MWPHTFPTRLREPDGQWVLVTGPTEEPVSLAEAKLHARITQANDDATIRRYIQFAREACEEYTGRGLLTQTWKLTLRSFADVLSLPRAAPLQSVTSVQYYDASGVLQTLAASFYDVDTTARPGRLCRASNQFWPALQADRQTGRVIVTYVVGWTTVDLVPERFKQGCRMYITLQDRNRDGLEANVEQAMNAIYACWNDRVSWIEPEIYPLGYRWPV